MDDTTHERIEAQQARYTEEVWNQGQLERTDSYFAPNAVVHNIPQGVTYDGVEEFNSWVTEVRETFPDLHVSVEETLVDGDRIVSRWTASGTNKGEMTAFGIGPTHETVEWEGVTVYQRDGETISEGWWYYDMLGILAQVGALPETMTA
ncbi:ester cyclase [Halobaculum limi]|uniref:ester cyclase n=1 Tax=Halobaculum limi TaxID=3031916 RepID=UPI0024058CC7|nr:ester cyclase [Halobaculum sp. YSMS11]